EVIYLSLRTILYVFFFQAEDGIRDFHVTGVQTCALPISTGTSRSISSRCGTSAKVACPAGCPTAVSCDCARAHRRSTWAARTLRSEERRVGKELRLRWMALMCITLMRPAVALCLAR